MLTGKDRPGAGAAVAVHARRLVDVIVNTRVGLDAALSLRLGIAAMLQSWGRFVKRGRAR